jgi:hypothetical protein
MGPGENPYEAPRAPLGPAVGVRSGRREDLRSIAVYQKGVLTCLLLSIVLVMAAQQVSAQKTASPGVGLALLGLVVANSLAATVFAVLLAIKVYDLGVGLLLGVLSLVPCAGLVVLLIINGRATKTLRANGHRVGLFGANLAEFRGS